MTSIYVLNWSKVVKSQKSIKKTQRADFPLQTTSIHMPVKKHARACQEAQPVLRPPLLRGLRFGKKDGGQQ